MIEQNQETGKFTFQLLRAVCRHFKSAVECKNTQTPKSIHHGNAVFYRCGSPQQLTSQKKAMLAEMYYKEEKLGVDGIAKTVGISKMTL